MRRFALMRVFYGIFAVALTVVAVLFALSNRQDVEVMLWPLPFTAQAPLFVLALGMFVIGFFCGGLATWLRGLGARLKASRRAKPLEREVAALRERLDVAGQTAGTDAGAQKTIAAGR
jgi:uncharacterized integral membrane protein